MNAEQLPPDVHLFLRTHIQTVLQLELLLLLHAHAAQWWTAEAANREHPATIDAVRQYLRALRDAKLLESTGGPDQQFRFAPERQQDVATIAAIAGLFRTHYYSIVEAIYAPRRRDILDFADAFRLNKKNDSDG